MTLEGCIEKEELDKLFFRLSDTKDVKTKGWSNSNEDEYSRNFRFYIKDKEYIIEWWTNMCYLHIGDLVVPFKYVKLSNTWPLGTKENLQFYDKNRYPCAILPVKFYKNN